MFARLPCDDFLLLACERDGVCLSQLLMNVPFTAIHFATYESAKKLLSETEDEALITQLTAGGVAGMPPHQRIRVLA